MRSSSYASLRMGLDRNTDAASRPRALRAIVLSAAVAAVLLGTGARCPAYAQDAVRAGSIQGSVIDGATRQPLPGAVIVVLGRGLDTLTGDRGGFVVAGVPAGLHRLQVVVAGYEPAILHDVVVRANRITTVTVRLDEAVGVREVVEVRPDYFSAAEESAVSTARFTFEEIRRSPGAAGDVSRMLRMLPSTAIQADQRNDLIVRGGSPIENLTVVDNIEIPNINHFSTQGASGGVIGMLNTDLIADVSFSSGGFSAEHGDRLSSVMVVNQREANRAELDGEVAASMAGAGVLFEGPLARGRGAWAVSARRSFLDLVADAIGTGGVVPEYSNVQGMATLDLGSTHQIRLLGLGGFDAYHEDDSDGEVVTDTDQSVAGVNWRWLWSGDGYAETSLAHTRNAYRVIVTDAPAEGRRGSLLFDNESREEEIVLRG